MTVDIHVGRREIQSEKDTHRCRNMSKKVKQNDGAVQKPLLIYYDCEAASGNLYQGDIIEIAARCEPSVIEASFENLINTTQELGWFAIKKCGITKDDLVDQPFFPEVLQKFFKWIKTTVKKANRKTSSKYFPVLCAHGGFGFDFIMLLGNLNRHNIDENLLKKTNLHFADSFDFCKELQASDFKELSGVRLSMDSLFSKFCRKKPFINRHRAIGDVNAMVDIFSQGSLKFAMNQIKSISAETLCSMFEKQYSLKVQQLLLEEKMSKLDAYTKCVNMKKLIQIQLTYEGIQRIFENCCSFMDFYETMKDHGIDRKTAKYFACQFGGLGLKNQGTVPYSSFTKPNFELEDGEEVPNKEEVDMIDPAEILREKNEYQRPVNVPEVPPDEFAITETSECWDSETDANRSFVIKLAKPAAALSVTIDEFVSPSKKTTHGGKWKSANSEVNPRSKKEFIEKKKKPNKRKPLQKQNSKGNQQVTEDTADVAKVLDVQLRVNNSDVLPTTDSSEPGTCSKKNFTSENYSSLLVVNLSENYSHQMEQSVSPKVGMSCQNESDSGENNRMQSDLHTEHHQEACAKDDQKDVLPNGNTFHHIYPNNSTTDKEKEIAKIAQLCTDCVVFADSEMDERQKYWPRVMILIGDIHIYVPIETAEEEMTTGLKSCYGW